MKRTRYNAPPVQVRCDCGAVWIGWATVANDVMESHRQRERDGNKMGCRVGEPQAWTPPKNPYVPKPKRQPYQG